ncbi:MAG: hypothetical protein ACOX81_00355 [Candidatus Heteroscillospira sp.]|jgi:Na+-transporting methylmalonyl-CoA/oxaloacetate decarboxylase beta subunit
MSIGIIGGADGPTKIFVSDGFGFLPLCVLAAAVIILAVLFWHKRHK